MAERLKRMLQPADVIVFVPGVQKTLKFRRATADAIRALPEGLQTSAALDGGALLHEWEITQPETGEIKLIPALTLPITEEDGAPVHKVWRIIQKRAAATLLALLDTDPNFFNHTWRITKTASGFGADWQITPLEGT